MRRPLVTLLCALFLCVATPALAQTTYFVSTTGNNGNDGSEGSPWLTLQKAAEAPAPGDTVRIFAGSYAGASVADVASLTFQPYGDGTVIITSTITLTANSIILKGTLTGDTKNLHVIPTGDNERGITVTGDNSTLQDIYVEDCIEGVFTHANADSTTIRRLRIFKCGGKGLEINGTNQTVEDNEIWGTLKDHPKWNPLPGWEDADGIHVFGTGHTFRRNYIHSIVFSGTGNEDAHIDAFQSFGNASGLLFEDNRIEFDDGYQATPGVAETVGFQFEDITDDVTVRRNRIKAYRCVNVVGTATNWSVLNNFCEQDLTWSDANAPEGFSMPAGTGNRIQNNVGYNIRTNWITGAVATKGYNAVTPDVGYTEDTGDLTHGTDLRLNGQKKPSRGSPLIDAGLDVSLAYNGTAPDIGFFETNYPTVLEVLIKVWIKRR